MAGVGLMASSAIPSLIRFADRQAMASRVADLVAAALRAGMGAPGNGEPGAVTQPARLLVSGGSTPAALYRELANRTLAWADVAVGLVDERWVPPSADGSNEAFVRETLLTHKARAASFIGMWHDDATPLDAAADVAHRYAGFARSDCIILGMGNDGHTASWFPRADGLDRALDDDAAAPLVTAVRAHESDITGAYLDRMTVTLKTVLGARLCILLLTGDEKKQVFESALDATSAAAMPVRALLAARKDLWVCWAP